MTAPRLRLAVWTAANAPGLIRAGSHWKFSDETILLENADS